MPPLRAGACIVVLEEMPQKVDTISGMFDIDATRYVYTN